MKLKEALQWGREALKVSPSPALDARLLLEFTLNVSSIYLLSHLDENIDSILFTHYQSLIERRSRGESVSKIRGRKEFYGRDFFVNKYVLDPRPDSEILIEAVLENIKDSPFSSQGMTILEIGVGSGCLLLTLLAELPHAQGVGVDISPQALSIAKKNAHSLNLDSRVHWLESDMFQRVRGKFDIIISNPPYIPTKNIQTLEREVQFFDPLIALDGGETGLDFYQKIALEGPNHLKTQGFFALEVGYGQVSDVRKIFSSFSSNTYKDLNYIERCIIIKS
jgi:release factor glutamine methyltransferase